ncbi:MAG: 2-oxoglutarate dehydrogenase complex dihydrolipoyllysine-residue succinyltransferase [Phycisphaerae bacterium]|nr:2-oxoglutarate dehydrogenase complex dihydrolipoyllysine-residue succinyltransferase [Phycisphaerae bacterium]
MPTDVTIPSPGESISEVRLGTWQKKTGEWVEKDDLLVEIESDKATLELLAPATGLLTTIASAGSDQKVGALVAKIDEAAAKPAGAGGGAKAAASAEAKPSNAAGDAKAAASKGTSAPESPVRATSVAKKIAADTGVDLANVSGSGPAGRVMKADVLSAASAKTSSPAEASAPSAKAASAGSAAAAPAPVAPIGSRGSRREKMTKLRQKIAERLVHAQHSAAMLTTFNECDMTEVMRLRAEHKESFEKQFGVGLGFMGFFVKAAVSALRKFPRVNAYISGDEIEFHDYCDIAVAVGTDRGLVVPVLRNAEAMSFADVESTIKALALKARDGKLTVDEMTGGTFTISNGGVYGSLMSTPILNPPQSAILGMHAIKKRAVEDPKNPGQLALRPMMYLALSYDHRIIDGAEAVGFLVHIKDCVEKPERMLFGV